jgi:RND family efflux transporter MFP subunit
MAVPELKDELASLRIVRDAPRHRRRWPWVVVVLLALAAGGWYLFGAKAFSNLSATEVEAVHASLETPAHNTPGTPILTASGYVVPRRKAVVSAKIQGRLSELRVEEGSRVGEGQIIARLESADYEAQVLRTKAAVQRAEADLNEARRQFRIAEGLAREKVASQDAMDAAASRVTLAEAMLSQARADLVLSEANYQNTLIKAPFTGVVVKKMAEVGESVAPIPPGVNLSTSSGAIVALADFATLEVEADVNESNVAKLRSDQPAEVSVEAFPERSYKAKLRQGIPTADRTKATVLTKVTLVEKDKDLKPEMSAKVTFLEPDQSGQRTSKQAASPVVQVPKEAVVTRNGKQVVFEIEENRVRERPVVAGVEWQGQIEIKQGLSGSETLVVNPPETLRDGDAVKVKG